MESKVFGIGVEAYTVGSAEFALSYAATESGIGASRSWITGTTTRPSCVSDKIPGSAGLLPGDRAAHNARQYAGTAITSCSSTTRRSEIATEIVRCGGLDGRVKISLDFFDASINRIAAWVVGYRNVQKSLLYALLLPDMRSLQDAGRWTEIMANREAAKVLPFGEVWDEYCRRCGVPLDGEWLGEVRRYEREVLSERG